MKKSEISDLVVLAAGNDFREISATNVEAWYKQFDGKPWLTYELAEKALVRFYDTETRKIMAADILRLAREVRTEILLANPLPDAAVELMCEMSELPGGYDAVQQAAQDATVAGADPVEAAKAAMAEHRRALAWGDDRVPVQRGRRQR